MNRIDPTGYKALTKNGSRGSLVKEIQNKMILYGIKDQYGATLKADGIFGSRTDTAVRKFQSTNGLVVDGKVGNNTWGLLDTSYRNYNFYGYAMNTFTNVQPASGSWGTVRRFRSSIIKKYGSNKARAISGKSANVASNEYRIAIRVGQSTQPTLNGARDFHLMKQDTQGWNYWSEKHGTGKEIQYYNRTINPDSWNSSYGNNDKNYNCNSQTLYLAIKFTRK